jgi:hypothetical protein
MPATFSAAARPRDDAVRRCRGPGIPSGSRAPAGRLAISGSDNPPGMGGNPNR